MPLIKYNNKVYRIYSGFYEAVDEQEVDEQISKAVQAKHALPKPKTAPDQETLDFWNEHHPTEIKRRNLDQKLTKLQEVKNKFTEG